MIIVNKFFELKDENYRVFKMTFKTKHKIMKKKRQFEKLVNVIKKFLKKFL